ncbi:hypothetical protein [Acidicapsa ligni]|uniref:hypothetical protein n=1 Tax=Acidicapsa ligni TaxID=542300 RepID=UPI0021DF9616|nr:hypothetical protein [Acidicapsa ligni]
MRRLVVLALVLIGTLIPVCAQRGGGHAGGGGFHGGSSGRAASGFRGGFSGSGSSHVQSRIPSRTPFGTSLGQRYAGGQRFSGNRFGAGSPGIRAGSYGGYDRSAGFANSRSGYRNGDHSHRPPYRSPYRADYRVGVLPGAGWSGGGWSGAGWIGSDYLGYPDDDGDGDYGAYPNDAGDGAYADDGYEASPDEQGPPPPYLAYRQSYDAPHPLDLSAPPRSSAAPLSESAVTLVFKDGRAPIQVHNYILTRTTLSILDQSHRIIPVSELDLAATEKANRDAGVDFDLPGTAN